MRWATPHPCIGSSASIFKISKSSVPCSRSVDGGMFPLTVDKRYTPALVERQGHENMKDVRVIHQVQSNVVGHSGWAACSNICRIWYSVTREGESLGKSLE